MATAGPTIGVLRAQVRAIRNKAPDARVFGISSPGRWTGPALHGEGSDQVAVRQCNSPLQMRLALQEAQDSAMPTVLVTPLDQAQLSEDILMRFALRRLHQINSWEIVRALFKAKSLDPRITQHAFLADLLLEHAATHEVHPVAGGLVDAETVWGILLLERLGLSGGHPDLAELLRCTAESDLAARWQACPVEFRAAASSWITETAGEAAGVVLRCLETEHGAEALALGLVMGVVYHEDVGHELDKAAGRLEAYVGTTNVSVDVVTQWRDAASACAEQIQKPSLRRSLDDAERILQHIGAAAHVWRSDELESGFEMRLSRLGRALAAHVDLRATAISEELQALYESIQQHRLWLDGGRRTERAEMAIRLAHWLANQIAAAAPRPSNLVDLAQAYAAEGGFVDWARQVLRGGEPNKDLAGAYVRLVDRVTELREIENQRFGQMLADQRAGGNPGAGLVPVEQVLAHVVTHVVEQVPVLVLLVDGMNWAVFRELVADIKARDWIELALDSVSKRLIGLAALPTITEVCRTSLLCGTLRRGQASDEVQGFAAHPSLVDTSVSGFAPRLFHKAALEGDEDSSLASDIRQALAEKRQRVVGIVINAVDDHLDKGDQIDATWTVQHIRVLEPILAEARAAGRAVLLLSDHGHVLDRQTECREATDGLRWRRTGTPVVQGEFEVSSPRVVVPENGRVIVPWSERLRYGARKNGYHGGCTPQEMLIPIAILWPELRLPPGLMEAPTDVPSWWIEPLVAVSGVPEVVAPEKPTKAKPVAPTLFEQPPVHAVATEEPWIAELLRTNMFAAQKQLAGRARVDDVKVRRLISTLVSRGGSMTAPALASVIGEPEHRLPGLLAITQRLLNVEGYAILDRQDASNTVVLNVPLLKRQFELGSP